MTVCIRCHRPLKRPTETGMGPVCARAMRTVPVPEHDRDLFGYDVEKAAQAARYVVQVLVESRAAEAYMGIKADYRRRMVQRGLWAA